MSAVAEVTAPSMIGRALAVRRQVIEAEWPESGQVQREIAARLRDLDEILAVRDGLLDDDDPDPYAVRAPEMGCDWDLDDALEYVDDQALEAAKGLKRRLDEGLRNQARTAAEREREVA